MTSVRILLIVVSSVFGLSSGCGNAANQADVQIVLRVSDSAARDTDVDIILEFHNHAEDSIRIYYFRSGKTITAAMDVFLFIDIVDKHGDSLVYDCHHAVVKLPYGGDTYSIPPEGTYIETINLARFYSHSKARDTLSLVRTEDGFVNKWAPGSYRVRCRYEYHHKPEWVGGEELWEGDVVSNEVTLTVAEPLDSEKESR